jgi:two-component system, chemotaxis family, protein-glutamate methylesterase/glutaminase
MRLPQNVGKTPEAASLVCPDCGGALAVQAEGDAAYLIFVCQVGHSYSSTTLVSGKEERLEEVLWSGVYLLEELADLLGDLVARGGPDRSHPNWPAARRRIGRLRQHAASMRAVLDDNEPIDLGVGLAPGRDTP